MASRFFPAARTRWLLLALALGPVCDTALAKLKVVATTPDLAAIARVIGGENIELATLVRPTEDPHFVDAKPSLIVKLNRADALIQGGAELEDGWLKPLLDGARNAKIAAGAPGNIRANQGIAMLEVPAALDRSKGDIHAAGNPHYLIDPLNAKRAAATIAESFAKLEPASAASFQANYARFADAIETKLAQWLKQLEPCKGQCVVAYHNSWIYFANRFGFKIDLFLEPKPGIPPTPAHLADVIGQMKQERAHVIIVDSYLDRRTADAVAGRTGAVVVEVSQFPGGVKGTDGGYFDLLDYLVTSLAQAFKTHKP